MESSIIFNLFLSLLLLQMVPNSSPTPRKIAPPYNPSPRRHALGPKIWLSSYSSTDSYLTLPADRKFKKRKYFENDYASKNLSDYIVYEGTHTVTFTCRALYPVTWTLPFPSQVLDLFYSELVYTKEIRESSFPEGRIGEEPENRAFISQLTLITLNLDFLSANFTCRSVGSDLGKASHESSIHVYASGIHALEKQGQTLQVPISYPEDPHYILPCRPATPSIEVTLQKQMISKSTSGDNSSMTLITWQEILQSNYLKFDPKVGFIMDKRVLGDQIFGLYRCLAEDDADNVEVKLNVTHKKSNDMDDLEEFKPFSWTKGNASISDDIEFFPSTLKCCSGVEKEPPTSIYFECRGIVQCQMYKEVMMEMMKNIKESKGWKKINAYTLDKDAAMGSDCSANNIWSGESLLYCKGKTMEYLEDFTKILYPNMDIIDKRKELEAPSHAEPTKKFMTHRVTLSNISSIHVDEKALIVVGYYPQYEVDTYRGNYFLERDLNPYTLDHNYLEARDHQIVEYQRNYYYEGEPLIFMCLSLKQFYSFGSHLRINWKNGTSTIVESSHDKEKGVNVFLYFSGDAQLSREHYAGFNFHPFIGKEVNASLEMKSVDCFIPPWDTWEWEVIHYEVEVRNAVLPKFLGEEEQTVYFYLNDKDKEISLNILEGTPIPKVSLEKDGKSLSKKKLEVEGDQDTLNGYNFTSNIDDFTDNWANTSASEISDKSYVVKVGFPIVTHDIQGVYQCTGENVKGRVSQTIRVIVTTRGSHVAVVTIEVLAVLLGLLLVGIGVFYKCQHRQVQNLRWGIMRL